MDLDEVSSLTLVESILRQRVDVLLDQRRALQTRRRAAAQRGPRGGRGDDEGPRERAGARPGCKQAADGERTGPGSMCDRPTSWVVRVVTMMVLVAHSGCVLKRDGNDLLLF